MRAPNPLALVVAATAAYSANVALGTAVATGAVDTRRCRWVHHALYTTTCVLAGGAVGSRLWSRSRAGWFLLPAAVPLVAVARLGARSPRHPVVALTAAPFFLASLVRALQEQHGVP